jgi:hypothetical protein
MEKITTTRMTSFPTFDDIKINGYDVVGGYYTLGFLKHHLKDCLFITYDQWQDYDDYTWLQKIIEQNCKKKTICILPWDEDVLGNHNSHLSAVLNQYIDEKVFWMPQMSSFNQLIYRYQYNIKCKMLELPWWLLNDVLTYYEAKKHLGSLPDPEATDLNYLCMIGNSYSKHKTWLIEYLISKHLDQKGLITVLDYRDYPEYFKNHVHQNPKDPYQDVNQRWPKMAAQTKIGDTWISKNVENFLHIEQTYDMPLMINPETSPGIFMVSEKSVWPVLLGKLYLLYGGPRSMSWVQQFYDIDQTDFCDINFDDIVGNYTDVDYRNRLESMIDSNLELICNSREIYLDLKPRLESARWTFGRKLYDFFVSQLCRIQ